MKAHPISEIFPVMGPDELAELAADIAAHGLREPVVTYERQILDGRNRWQACKLAGIGQVQTVPYDGDDPLGFVVSANLHRRHLSTSQRAMIAATLANGKHGGDRRQEQGANLPLETVAGAAEALNVSERTVKAAREVNEKGTAGEVQAVRSGDVTVSRAEADIRRKEKDIRDAAAADPDRYREFADRLDAGDKPADVHKAFAKERGRQTTKGEPMKDGTGYDVPMHLRDLFGDPWLLQTAEAVEVFVRDTLKTVKGRVVRKGTAYSFMLCGDILKALECAKEDLEIAHSQITEARPHAVHRACAGKGCKNCRMSGWLPKWRWAELRELGLPL